MMAPGGSDAPKEKGSAGCAGCGTNTATVEPYLSTR